MLATSWNCSKRLTGKKLTMLYLEVLMQLLWGRMGQEGGLQAAEAP